MFPCLNKTVLGIECTGCGGQRAALLLFQGNFREAFFMYPAIYSLALLFIFLLVNLFIKFKHDFSIKMGLIILNAVVIAGAYIFKMIHIFN
ncbi:DUF2752 domain-containing protein [Christiangramia sp. SM2212]|uniref:DUF2752 domain-containing protein n=1 Tax=Christiangramia sediminicola TaxID=3073267 RepID=A0ABU1EUG2_9FLAO|nr:DUF2752 domain-containing protein [Christiangramia sp. SM2212]MDR5592032.1 DUF2752 domain-containing protein [Christiangramia sp. SM2212]